MAGYIGKSVSIPTAKITEKRQSYTATADQTVFTVTGGYDAGFADVYLNGVKLVNNVDVDVSIGTGFTLTTGATAGDNVDFIGYGAFEVADTYTQAEADSLLDAKVNTSAIGTAAASDVTTSSTDNTLGRLLKVGDFGVGKVVNYVNNPPNPNTFFQAGTYIGYNWAGAPSPSWATLINYNNNADIYRQELKYTYDNASATTYVRYSSNNGATFTPWFKEYNQRNILGTVAQSGGIPTGAIIERGSNANGEYTKYADGTLICLIQFTQPNVNHNVASGNLFWPGGYYASVTYPSSFSILPNVHITMQPVNHAGAILPFTDGYATTTSPGVISSICNSAIASQSIICSITATGRWF